jgi:drug/metabolite transporter (DMT)-like permease
VNLRLPSFHPIVYIMCSGIFGVAGQLVLKRGLASLGVMALRLDTAPQIILSLALNPLVIVGLIVYLIGTLFWLVALSRVDLSYAYPFASLNYGLVLVASWLILGERPSAVRLIGVIVICTGVWAISRTPSRTARSPEKRDPLHQAIGTR